MRANHAWPTLPTTEWRPTIDTLHRWSQVIGKIRMTYSPWLNHSWSVALHVTPVGLTTGTVPHGDEAFELMIDITNGRVVVARSTGEPAWFDLRDGLSVADFYDKTVQLMAKVGMDVEIYTTPSEIADAVPFPDDHEHATPCPTKPLRPATTPPGRCWRSVRAPTLSRPTSPAGTASSWSAETRTVPTGGSTGHMANPRLRRPSRSRSGTKQTRAASSSRSMAFAEA